jgi:hypothetical protein
MWAGVLVALPLVSCSVSVLTFAPRETDGPSPPSYEQDEKIKTSVDFGRRSAANRHGRFRITVTEVTLRASGDYVPHAIRQLIPPVQLTTDDSFRRQGAEVIVKKPPLKYHVISRDRVAFLIGYAGGDARRVFAAEPYSGQLTKGQALRELRYPHNGGMTRRDLGTTCSITASPALTGKVQTVFDISQEELEGFVDPSPSTPVHRPVFSIQRGKGHADVPDGGGLFVLISGGTQEVEDRWPIPVAGSLFAKRYEERILHGLVIKIESVADR